MKKKGFIIGFIIFSLVLSGGYGIGAYFVNYALSPTSSSHERNISDSDKIDVFTEGQKIIEKNKQKEMAIGNDFMKNTKPMNIIANDSIRLKAQYLTHENNHMWTILIHGYKSDNTNMMSYGAKYYEQGYNVLLPNNRAHGTSEGDYIGMG